MQLQGEKELSKHFPGSECNGVRSPIDLEEMAQSKDLPLEGEKAGGFF